MRVIPPITDPLGRHWSQPDTSQIDVAGTYAILTTEEFKKLPEYSTTFPSGVYHGKAWKCRFREGGWGLCWYGIDEDPKFCTNNVIPIIVVEPLCN